MPDPMVYDMSYRTNIGGVFIPPEYITNFVAGEVLELNRSIIKMPFVLNTVSMLIKPSEGSANTLLVKNISADSSSSNGYFTQDASFNATLLMIFDPSQTLLLDSKRYFVLEANWVGGNSNVISQGYIKGSLQQVASANLPGLIVIDNLPGTTTISTLQIIAHVEDAQGNVLTGYRLQFFTSDSARCPISDTGLVRPNTAGTYVITAASVEANIATRATLVVTP